MWLSRGYRWKPWLFMTLYWLFYSGLRRHYIITIRDEWRHAWTCILGGGKKLLAKLSSLILMERAWYPDRILHLSRARLKINWPRGKRKKKKKHVINDVHGPKIVFHLCNLKCMMRQKRQNLLPFEVKVVPWARAVWVDATAGVHTKH